ncbi:MAG: Uma2 family endonuclease [Planctomycetia bacterium]|nr:Uma2 family endonuclease [Planctomycetia bacterium]
MATDNPTSDVPFSPGLGHIPHLLTAADLAAMPSELPSGPVRFELDNGVLITMSPPGGEHGFAENVIARELGNQGQVTGLGISVCGEVGIILRRNPDRVVGADVAYFSKSKFPVKRSREGYYETIPDLVVEVESKNDTRAYLKRKVSDYHLAGVSIVWIVNPKKRTLVEYRAGLAPVTFDEAATVELPGLIPGFRLRLADVFNDPSV